MRQNAALCGNESKCKNSKMKLGKTLPYQPYKMAKQRQSFTHPNMQPHKTPGIIDFGKWNRITVNQTYLLILALCQIRPSFNPLPNDKILDWSKLKQIEDDILKCI